MIFYEVGSYIYILPFATPGIPSKIYISLYKLSSDLKITEKRER